MMQPAIITTVTTPASSYDLTTLDNVKAELDITDGKQDPALKRYITSASTAAAQYCNRKFQAETVQDEIICSDHFTWQVSGRFEVLQLARWPLITVVSVTEDGQVLTEGTDFLVDPPIGALYRLDANGNRIKWSTQPKVVQYEAGYAEIPSDVEDAVIRMVTRRFLSKGRDPNLKQQNVPGVLEQSWWIATGSESGNMSPDITDILDNYRMPLAV